MRMGCMTIFVSKRRKHFHGRRASEAAEPILRLRLRAEEKPSEQKIQIVSACFDQASRERGHTAASTPLVPIALSPYVQVMDFRQPDRILPIFVRARPNMRCIFA